ncbi:MAG: pseudouridine-5'-phosphate glycosidase [Sneathiellaceae bacterium]
MTTHHPARPDRPAEHDWQARPGGPAGFAVAGEVAAALRDGRPVVALESTILSHGFPHPRNRALADEMLAAVRAAGAEPALVAVADGAIQVGAGAGLLDRLCRGGAAHKASRRDLAVHIAAGHLAATTVAATAWAAARCGIGVFATGGIGGVHRYAATLPPAFPDLSGDIPGLADAPIAVISAGAKSILDLPATMEALEAFGVPVVGYRTGEFPAFHAADSGIALAHAVQDIEGLAAIVATQRRLGLSAAILVVQPPPEGARIAMAELEGWIAEALAQAEARGIAGPAVTPFLLAAMDRLSAGRTTGTNAALAVANAGLGGALAVALAQGAI